MSNKPIIVISSIAVVAVIAFIGAILLNRNSPTQPEIVVAPNQLNTPVPEPESKCPEIPQNQQHVSISLAQVSQVKNVNRTYRIMLETRYPVNVAKATLMYDPKVLKFERVDSSNSVFPIEAPSDALVNGVVSVSRGVSGKGAGLVGTGILTDVAFTEIKGIKNTVVPDPAVDLVKSAVYLNNGCAAKATIQLKD